MQARSNFGLTLVEVVAVLVVAMVIAAVAIPNLLNSKVAAQEGSAMDSLRTILAAQTAYNAAYPQLGFATSLAKLGPEKPNSSAHTAVAPLSFAHAGMIDAQLATTTKNGYAFSLSTDSSLGSSTVDRYVVQATPLVPAEGARKFCMNQSGIVRQQTGDVPCDPVGSSLVK